VGRGPVLAGRPGGAAAPVAVVVRGPQRHLHFRADPVPGGVVRRQCLVGERAIPASGPDPAGDEPVVAPAYYVDVINDCILPKYEKVRQSTDAYSGQGNGGQLENKDESRMVEIKYAVDIEEIDAKYQTVDTIIEFVKMVNSDDCPPELSAYQGELRLGQMSFNNNNYAWSELNKGRKKEVKKVATANS